MAMVGDGVATPLRSPRLMGIAIGSGTDVAVNRNIVLIAPTSSMSWRPPQLSGRPCRRSPEPVLGARIQHGGHPHGHGRTASFFGIL